MGITRTRLKLTTLYTMKKDSLSQERTSTVPRSFTHENIFDNLCRLIKFMKWLKPTSQPFGISLRVLVFQHLNQMTWSFHCQITHRLLWKGVGKKDFSLRSPEVTGKIFNYFKFPWEFVASCLFIQKIINQINWTQTWKDPCRLFEGSFNELFSKIKMKVLISFWRKICC